MTKHHLRFSRSSLFDETLWLVEMGIDALAPAVVLCEQSNRGRESPIRHAQLAYACNSESPIYRSTQYVNLCMFARMTHTLILALPTYARKVS